jgi:predicted RNA-binding Zn-ribbon protein involved in translation (DUF1610 family)
LSPKEIKELTLEPLIRKLSHKSTKDDPYCKWQLVTPLGLKGSIRTSGFYFCPKCLAEDNAYLKKQWKLAWVIACPRHKNLLVLTCEQCGQVFSPHKVTYEQPHIHICTNCGFDLRESFVENIDEEALHFQEKLLQIALHGFTKTKFPLVAADVKDLFLTLTLFLSLFAHINKKDKYADIFKRLEMDNKYSFRTSNNTTFARMHIKDKEHLLCVVSRLFQIPLDDIIILFKAMSMTQYGLQRTFKSISPTIKHILNHLDNKVIFKPSRTLSREISPKSKEEVDKLFEEIKDYIQI